MKKIIENIYDNPWYWKIIAEPSINKDFWKFIKYNNNLFSIVWIDLYINEWNIISWHIHLRSNKTKKKSYKELPDWLSFYDIFSWFHQLDFELKNFKIK